jgi:hypothetical protein
MEASELLVQWERDFVGWWDANVGVRHAAGKKKNADQRSTLSKDKAEAGPPPVVDLRQPRSA